EIKKIRRPVVAQIDRHQHRHECRIREFEPEGSAVGHLEGTLDSPYRDQCFFRIGLILTRPEGMTRIVKSQPDSSRIPMSGSVSAASTMICRRSPFQITMPWCTS